MLADEVEQALARPAQLPQQLRTQLVVHERVAAPRERLGRGAPEDELQEALGALPPEGVLERLPEVAVAARREVQRVEDCTRSAEPQERHVAEVVLGRPFEQPQGFLLADAASQLLARPVPVDQEDQARAEELQKDAIAPASDARSDRS